MTVVIFEPYHSIFIIRVAEILCSWQVLTILRDNIIVQNSNALQMTNDNLEHPMYNTRVTGRILE